MTAAVNEKSELSLFVEREIDDWLELDPYKFRIYARMTHRTGDGKAWENRMVLIRVRKPMRISSLAEITQITQ